MLFPPLVWCIMVSCYDINSNSDSNIQYADSNMHAFSAASTKTNGCSDTPTYLYRDVTCIDSKAKPSPKSQQCPPPLPECPWPCPCPCPCPCLVAGNPFCICSLCCFHCGHCRRLALMNQLLIYHHVSSVCAFLPLHAWTSLPTCVTHLANRQMRLPNQHLLIFIRRIRMIQMLLKPCPQDIRHVFREVPPAPSGAHA